MPSVCSHFKYRAVADNACSSRQLKVLADPISALQLTLQADNKEGKITDMKGCT